MASETFTQISRRAVDFAAVRSVSVARLALRAKAGHGADSRSWEAALLRTCGPGELAVDVGAHIGMVTRILATRFTRVIAVEPNPSAAWRLASTAPSNVTVLGAAMGAGAAVGDLRTPVVHGRDVAALSTLARSADRSQRTKDVGVVIMTLDSLEMSALDFLKIDVEGFETEVVEGAAAVLGRFRPPVLVESEERHRPGAPAAVRAALAQHGLTGFFVYDGQVLPAAEFDPDRHQVCAPGADGRVAPMSYANNFFYVREEDAASWRRRIETAVGEVVA